MNRRTIKLILPVLMLAASLAPLARGLGQYELTLAQNRNQNTVMVDTHDADSIWTWKITDTDSHEDTEVRVVNKVEFTEDYTDIKSIAQGGSIRIEETRNGETRR